MASFGKREATTGSILDRPLGRGRGDVSLSAFALLFSEVVQYLQQSAGQNQSGAGGQSPQSQNNGSMADQSQMKDPNTSSFGSAGMNAGNNRHREKGIKYFHSPETESHFLLEVLRVKLLILMG